MVTAREIAAYIDSFAPERAACEDDVVGLCIGDPGRTVKKILLSLDLTFDVIEEAREIGADLIVTHHPLYVKVDGKMLYSNDEQNKMAHLLQYDIAFLAAHTNLDTAPEGVNDVLAKRLGLTEIEPLEDIYHFTGVTGKMGSIAPVTFEAFIGQIKHALLVPHVKYVGDPEAVIRRVGVVSGSAGEYVPYVKTYSLDLLVTSDVKYHQAMYAHENGILLADAGHFETEVWVIDYLHERLCGKFGPGVQVQKTQVHTKSFWNYA